MSHIVHNKYYGSTRYNFTLIAAHSAIKIVYILCTIIDILTVVSETVSYLAISVNYNVHFALEKTIKKELSDYPSLGEIKLKLDACFFFFFSSPHLSFPMQK